MVTGGGGGEGQVVHDVVLRKDADLQGLLCPSRLNARRSVTRTVLFFFCTLFLPSFFFFGPGPETKILLNLYKEEVGEEGKSARKSERARDKERETR